MFVGYEDDHAGDVYRFINIQTKKVIGNGKKEA